MLLPNCLSSRNRTGYLVDLIISLYSKMIWFIVSVATILAGRSSCQSPTTQLANELLFILHDIDNIVNRFYEMLICQEIWHFFWQCCLIFFSCSSFVTAKYVTSSSPLKKYLYGVFSGSAAAFSALKDGTAIGPGGKPLCLRVLYGEFKSGVRTAPVLSAAY